MIKRTIQELKSYVALGHYNMTAMRLHGKEETGAEEFWVGLSTFLPGGGAEYAYENNPMEKFYYVIEGEMTVKDKEGNEYILHAGESISLKPYEGRYLKNNTNKPTVMLVVVNYMN